MGGQTTFTNQPSRVPSGIRLFAPPPRRKGAAVCTPRGPHSLTHGHRQALTETVEGCFAERPLLFRGAFQPCRSKPPSPHGSRDRVRYFARNLRHPSLQTAFAEPRSLSWRHL